MSENWLRIHGCSNPHLTTSELMPIAHPVDIPKIEKAFARENIGMMIVGDEGGCNKGCCPSTFFLQVRREDAQAASALIQEDFRQVTGLEDFDTSHSDAVFNEAEGQATCPACGFEFETSTTTCPDCGLCFA